MYGLINRAIEEMAIQTGGHDIWQAIKLKAGFDESTFISMQAYPDKITYKLIDAASVILNISTDDLFKQFGKHWILFSAQQGYGNLLKISGNNMKEFINNLDQMHFHISTSMPELRPPSFECVDINDHEFDVLYRSEREGLAPMVLGLLEGLSEMLKTKVNIEDLHTKPTKGYDTFKIRYL